MQRPGFLSEYSGFGATNVPTITNITLTPATIPSGNVLNVSITVVNNSNVALQTCSPAPGYVYNEGENFYTHNFQPITGAYRVGIDFDGNSTGTDHPYRWGLGKTLAPGESVTVTGSIRLKTTGSKRYWAGLVKEWVAWQQDNQGATTITVTPPSAPTLVAVPTPISIAVNPTPVSTLSPTVVPAPSIPFVSLTTTDVPNNTVWKQTEEEISDPNKFIKIGLAGIAGLVFLLVLAKLVR